LRGGDELSYQSRKQVFEFLEQEIIGPKASDKKLDIRTQPVSFLSREASVGPWICAETSQEILPIKPRDRYGSGVLEPVKSKEEQASNPSESFTEVDLVNNPDVSIGEIDNLADKSPASTDEARDSLDLEVKSNRAWLNPRSLGASFFLETQPNGKIELTIKGGTYRPITVVVAYTQKSSEVNLESQPEGAGKQREYIWYVREEFHQVFELNESNLDFSENRKLFKLDKLTSIGKELSIEVSVLARRISSNRYLCTVSFVNRSIKVKDENTLYQTSIDIKTNTDCKFIAYPEARRDFDMDVDDESALLLYRNYPTFAIGHNIGINWNREAGLNTDALHLTPMPVYEAPSITPSISFANGIEVEIDMRTQSNPSEKRKAMSVLKSLIDEYQNWIIARELEASNDPLVHENYKRSAALNISECQEALKRMEAGLRLLETDDQVYEAYRLTNKAMLMQQYHSRLPERKVLFNGRVSVPEVYPSQEIPKKGGMWRPFQIAFLLSVLESIANPNSEDRELVDLIFFPTGGGKTEAYLGVSAFTILLRRLRNLENSGTVVLMRYTLRLLTTQQFIRAAALICALEIIRRRESERFGIEEFSIGAWLGGAVTPNTHQKAIEALPELRRRGDRAVNPFLLLKCPWCGCTLGPIKNDASANDEYHTAGYKVVTTSPREFRFFCPDSRCDFATKLPLSVIDEEIYRRPPTLIIGTVDKFAQMSWQEGARSIFGIDSSGVQTVSPPELIIQDEFHLISGPLGSMVGLYEGVIEGLCTAVVNGQKVLPKIISSTATIRRFKAQAEAIYGRNRVSLFPPPGLDAADSFFAVWARENGKLVQGRMYVGINAPGLGSVQSAQVRVGAALAQAPMDLDTDEERDPWWTNLWFFNSIRELSNTVSLFQSDIPNYLLDMKRRYGTETRHLNTINELTSRRQSHELPKILSELEKKYKGLSDPSQRGIWDACLASNIIEVGIDIPRLSLMTIVSQPKSTSQYIQVSGRVGREWNVKPGLVVTIYTSNRPRDLSHYEHFRSYHEKLYAQVEPTSVTPFASPVIKRALRGAVVAFVRMKCPINIAPKNVDSQLVLEILEKIIIRARKMNLSVDDLNFLEKEAELIINEWTVYRGDEWGTQEGSQNGLLIAPTEDKDISGYRWSIPVSMRSVDASVELEISRRYRLAQLDEVIY
jgi:hypothetical protein